MERESEAILLVTESKDFRDRGVRAWALQLASYLTLGKFFSLLHLRFFLRNHAAITGVYEG